ncbi:MAG: hypothetical protein IPN26_16440 [Bacteroidetes bacterium]|nr:hypothetical protein [Bacteroidota bacterium]
MKLRIAPILMQMSICISSRNANNATREVAIILPVGNEGILIPFGKPWTTNGSGFSEIGQSSYQVQLLGGMKSKQAIRSGSWAWWKMHLNLVPVFEWELR